MSMIPSEIPDLAALIRVMDDILRAVGISSEFAAEMDDAGRLLEKAAGLPEVFTRDPGRDARDAITAFARVSGDAAADCRRLSVRFGEIQNAAALVRRVAADTRGARDIAQATIGEPTAFNAAWEASHGPGSYTGDAPVSYGRTVDAIMGDGSPPVRECHGTPGHPPALAQPLCPVRSAVAVEPWAGTGCQSMRGREGSCAATRSRQQARATSRTSRSQGPRKRSTGGRMRPVRPRVHATPGSPGPSPSATASIGRQTPQAS